MFASDPSRPLATAERAAALGFDGVFAADHLFPPTPGGREKPSLEVFSILAAVAARHPELHVGTLVARVTLRPVGLLAKEAASLDRMSGGKAILALGTGDAESKAEHEVFGIPDPDLATRRSMLGETLDALGALFEGHAYAGGAQVPAIRGPLIPPGSPELWVGGRGTWALEAAARAARAWNGWGLSAEAFAVRAERLRELAAGRPVAPTWAGIVLVGEDAADLDLLLDVRTKKGLPPASWSGTTDELRSFANELERLGTSWCIVLAAGPADRLELIARTLRA